MFRVTGIPSTSLEESVRVSQKMDAVLKKDPGNARALYFQAIVRQHLGRAEDAIPLLEKVLAGHPRDGAAWYLLALCKQRVGQPADAGLFDPARHGRDRGDDSAGSSPASERSKPTSP